MMNNRKSNKKLLLSKESLRTLHAKELSRVAGGAMNRTASCTDCGGGGGGGGGGGEDTYYACWDSYLACYF